MSETRKLAGILVADVVGYSRLAGSDEERTLERLRALRSDLIDASITVHHGRVVKRTGDGSLSGIHSSSSSFESSASAIDATASSHARSGSRRASRARQRPLDRNCRVVVDGASAATATCRPPARSSLDVDPLRHQRPRPRRPDLAP
jgi:class 3 adenylate cyclase